MNEINIKDIRKNVVKMISEDWALVTAGNKDGWNTMTISWGGVGELWGKDVVFVFIRPQRYTKEFMDREGRFTLNFFDGEYKKELGLCGKYSGRDCDKAKETGLIPIFDGDNVYIEQANTVIVCKTLSVEHLNPENFIDKNIEDFYPNKDYHEVYIAEIEKILEK
ncbi:hypothetical protein SDC9_101890 [bioreactor metagenome]|uniref:Flavin reductase like domain-containing protein n=1 Tax=bioreactor metagenome TaxID=1076179 RepID=A0A645APC8_9ZZZZ